MSASKIPRNWKDIVKKYYFLEILVEGLRTDRSLSSSQSSENTKDYSKKGLTIISLTDNNTIGWRYRSSSFANTISISKDEGKTWNEYTATSIYDGQTGTYSGTTLATLNKGDKLLIKGNNDAYGGAYDQNYVSFTSTDDFYVEGNIMSLVYGDNFQNQETLPSQYTFCGIFAQCNHLISAKNLILPAKIATKGCYRYMFYYCTDLIEIPELPITELSDFCYEGMFIGCRSLTTQIKKLPVTTLKQGCYHKMFSNCTNLTVAPELSATECVYLCYDSMFEGCTSLVSTPELPATTLAQMCYTSMFEGCTSLTNVCELPAERMEGWCYTSMFKGCTSLVNAPELPSMTLAGSCYSSMFENCTSLIEAPELPATELATYCYNYMFKGCSSLTTPPELPALSCTQHCYEEMFMGCTSLVNAPELPATSLAEDCYEGMFTDCTSLTVAPELPATNLSGYCYWRMFSGCTSLTTAPVLAANTLKTQCYRSMFQDCSNLNSITCLATNISATKCVDDWVSGVATNGTFIKNSEMSNWTSGVSGIPNYWTVTDYQ